MFGPYVHVVVTVFLIQLVVFCNTFTWHLLEDSEVGEFGPVLTRHIFVTESPDSLFDSLLSLCNFPPHQKASTIINGG